MFVDVAEVVVVVVLTFLLLSSNLLFVCVQGEVSDSIIMYSSQASTGQGDFVALLIHNKSVEFRYMIS